MVEKYFEIKIIEELLGYAILGFAILLMLLIIIGAGIKTLVNKIQDKIKKKKELRKKQRNFGLQYGDFNPCDNCIEIECENNGIVCPFYKKP